MQRFASLSQFSNNNWLQVIISIDTSSSITVYSFAEDEKTIFFTKNIATFWRQFTNFIDN